MSGQFPWYVARSAGLVAWALLAASVLWGLALSTKILSPKVRANWILDLHRWLGGLATIFVGYSNGYRCDAKLTRWESDDQRAVGAVAGNDQVGLGDKLGVG